jgi:hypothetical protein
VIDALMKIQTHVIYVRITERMQMKTREKIQRRYKPGQIIRMCRRDDKGNIIKRYKVKIIDFYPYHVLVERNGFRESYTYWDMEQLTMIKGGEPIAK